MNINDVKIGDFIQYKQSYLNDITLDSSGYSSVFKTFLEEIYYGRFPNRFQIIDISPSQNLTLYPNPSSLSDVGLNTWGMLCLERFEPAKPIQLFEDIDLLL